MDDVITLSSDSDKDSDVEIVGSYGGVMIKPDPLPLAAVRVDVSDASINLPTVSSVTVETRNVLKMSLQL